MPLTLTIISHQEPATAQESTKVIDQGHVSIGRALENDWVLADPGHVLSRQHCIIQYRDDEYYITDTSANGVFINESSQRLGRGHSVKLNHGDIVSIGAYTMRVGITSVDSAYATAGEQTDLLVRPASQPPESSFISDISPEDSLLTPGESSSFSQQPVPENLDLLKDSDPYELVPQPQLPQVGEPENLPPERKFSQPTEPAELPSISDAAGGIHPDRDSEEAGPTKSPEEAVSDGAVPRNVHPENDATGSLLHLEPEPIPAHHPESEPEPEPISPHHPEPKSLLPRQPEPEPTPSPPPLEAQPAPDAPAQMHAAAPASSPDEGARAALQAFLNGAGLPELQISDADIPEIMNMMGEIFHETVEGLMEVLVVRSNIKRAIGTRDLTTIRPKQNNPLKFSLSLEDAMINLLTKRGPGYLPPVEALKEGFNDIKAHEIAMIAGIQAALNHLLKRFDPKVLEMRLGRHSLLENILIGSQKARYWDAFTALYAEIAEEAEYDFQELLDREFARAYEEQMRKL